MTGIIPVTYFIPSSDLEGIVYAENHDEEEEEILSCCRQGRHPPGIKETIFVTLVAAV